MKSIKKNYIFNVSYQVLLLIIPLILTPYVSRVLGPEGVGRYSYADSIVAYFVLFATMGISIYGQREISYVQADREKRTQVFWETKILSVITSLCSLIVYIPFIVFNDNWPLYLVLAFNILSVTFDVTWFFQGMEEFGKIVFRNLIIKIINVACIFLLVKTKDDVAVYGFCIAFFVFLGNISLWLSLPKYIGRPDFLKIKPFRNIKVVLSLFVPTIAIQIYTVMDKTMIGLFTTNSLENGYYEQAIKISKMVLTLVTSLGTVMIPRIGFHFERKEYDMVEHYMYRGYRFVWFLGIPLTFGLIGIASNFVPWFFGPGYEKVVFLLSVLAFLIIAIGISNVTGMQYLVPTKRQKMLTISVVIGACVNFAMNLVLIPMFQASGAAIASVVAEFTITIVQLYYIRKELSVKRIIKNGFRYFIAGMGMLAVLLMEGYFLSSSIGHTFFMILTGGAVYVVVLLVLRDEFLLKNLKRVTGRFFKS